MLVTFKAKHFSAIETKKEGMGAINIKTSAPF
jgi:hypothetical protein